MSDRTRHRFDEGNPASPVGVVALLGGGGFIGGVLAAELRSRGTDVRPIAAPRLAWHDTGRVPPEARPEVVEELAARLAGAHVVINAAGVADPAAAASPALYGANALLPVLAARASVLVGARRFIHLSSIAVQPEGALDETARAVPFSPYSHSRSLAERVLLGEASSSGSGTETVVFRPTSVHGPGRGITRTLVKFARSPMSCVAGDGSAPTPQVLVGQVAKAVAQVTLFPGPVPPIVLQPWTGMTTGLLLRLLGGREPRRVPPAVARRMVRGLGVCSRVNVRAYAQTRRLDMLLFGRCQVPGWLADHGLAPAPDLDAWRRLVSPDGSEPVAGGNRFSGRRSA